MCEDEAGTARAARAVREHREGNLSDNAQRE
jgi:hypothetical protein